MANLDAAGNLNDGRLVASFLLHPVGRSLTGAFFLRPCMPSGWTLNFRNAVLFAYLPPSWFLPKAARRFLSVDPWGWRHLLPSAEWFWPGPADGRAVLEPAACYRVRPSGIAVGRDRRPAWRPDRRIGLWACLAGGKLPWPWPGRVAAPLFCRRRLDRTSGLRVARRGRAGRIFWSAPSCWRASPSTLRPAMAFLGDLSYPLYSDPPIDAGGAGDFSFQGLLGTSRPLSGFFIEASFPHRRRRARGCHKRPTFLLDRPVTNALRSTLGTSGTRGGKHDAERQGIGQVERFLARPRAGKAHPVPVKPECDRRSLEQPTRPRGRKGRLH